MEDVLRHTGKITKVHIDRIDIDEPFIDFASRFASDPGTLCLMSGGNLDCARYHMVAAKPWLVLSGRGNAVSIQVGGRNFQFESDPFDTLRFLLKSFRIEDQAHQLPVFSGLFGYLSYDLKDNIEELPRTSVDDLCLPGIYFTAPSVLVVHDKHENKTYLCIPERDGCVKSSFDEDLLWFESVRKRKIQSNKVFSGDGKGFRSNFDKPSYMESIRKIRDYITAGDIYQVNMSQRFEAGFNGSTYSFFKALYDKNPAPFFAYVNGGNHQLVSTSPERFIRQNKHFVESRPIKGTRPRGKNPREDDRLKNELSMSKKDDAELSMIVDLMRNDMGKVCKGGSVHVTEHKRVEAYQNVYHLISIVEGELDDDRDSVDLIRATFPGGSITGCPKIRAMEIIDELETNRRHIYTGSIGYISFHDTMDFSIAIRTASIFNNRIIFSVGGGVVFDSDPEDEYEETIHKGRTLLDAFSGSAVGNEIRDYAWINGALRPLENISLPLADLGVQYGFGFFETIRVENGRVQYLEDHLNRLYGAWKVHFAQEVPDLSWDEIIGQVVSANGLHDKVAAVKIIATNGENRKPPYDNRLIVTARPYTHRLKIIKKSGIDLVVHQQPRQTPLASYKSMNYLFYYLAGKEALEKGGDEALILNTDGSVSETNTANILFINGTHIIQPVSGHYLPGVMEARVVELFMRWDYTIEQRKVMPDEVASFGQVILTNSLMGAVPVDSFQGSRLSNASWICSEINREVL